MGTLQGLKPKSREQLSALLRNSKGAITTAQAVKTLNLPANKVSGILFNFARHGWLSRIRRDLYVPVPIESNYADVALEDPWGIASKIYSPCYIGGWSAANYWGFTEQIFRTIIVITTQKVRNRNPIIRDIPFKIKTTVDKFFFGTKIVWNDQSKSLISDPTKTIIDLLHQPRLGGGIISTMAIFKQYLKSKYADMKLLMEYASQIDNKAVYKRLGFILEIVDSQKTEEIMICLSKIGTGLSRLDPDIPAGKVITKWKLWIPGGLTID